MSYMYDMEWAYNYVYIIRRNTLRPEEVGQVSEAEGVVGSVRGREEE